MISIGANPFYYQHAPGHDMADLSAFPLRSNRFESGSGALIFRVGASHSQSDTHVE